MCYLSPLNCICFWGIGILHPSEAIHPTDFYLSPGIVSKILHKRQRIIRAVLSFRKDAESTRGHLGDFPLLRQHAAAREPIGWCQLESAPLHIESSAHKDPASI